MKLVTFRISDHVTQAGVVAGERIVSLNYPTVLELLRDPEGLAQARQALGNERGQYFVHRKEYTLNEVVLLSPIPEPPSVRDFYAFEQHVKAPRARRGLAIIPESYEIPTFYFSTNSEIYGHAELVPLP